MSSLETEESQLATAELTLCGLAGTWEHDGEIRQRARQEKALLIWTKPAAVGIANMSLDTKI